MQVNAETVEKVLKGLGYNLIDRGKYWQTNALYRNGDNKTALQIWKESGIWKDFVEGGKYRSFQSLLWLSGNGDTDRIKDIIKSINSYRTIYFEETPAARMICEEFIDNEIVKKLLPHYDFYNKKGISDKTLKMYKGGFCMSDKMNGRFVFPIYDENQMIVGLTGRHLLWTLDSNLSKWKHLGRKANWVYPVFLPSSGGVNFLEEINNKKEIILIEGVGDSLALSEQGVYNHMVVFGLSLSSKQIAFLLRLGLNKIIISYNNDISSNVNRGLVACINTYIKLLSVFDIDRLEIRLPIKKDFGEMLEQGIPLEQWNNKKVNQASCIKYILSHAKSLDIDIKPPQRKLLTNKLAQIDANDPIISK